MKVLVIPDCHLKPWMFAQNETIDVFGRSIIFGLVEHPQRLVVTIAFLAIIAELSANHQTTNPKWSIRVCHKRRPERRISGQNIRQITGERSVQPENQIRDAVNQLLEIELGQSKYKTTRCLCYSIRPGHRTWLRFYTDIQSRCRGKSLSA